jgi:eukaryotic-like serine/threonine-protein kinase
MRPRTRLWKLGASLGASLSSVCAGLGALACSSPDLDGVVFSCASNADCLAGHVCGERDGIGVCVPAERGPITLGMSGPFRGMNEELGVELRRGILAQLEHVNRDGGVLGRQLQLESKNDDGEPELAVENVEALLDLRPARDGNASDGRGPNGVFALLGNIGTPTTLVTAPLANDHGVILFSPFTGAQGYLRDGTRPPYVYNFRPGHFEEAEVIVEYMASQRQPRIISDPPGDSYSRLLVFAQNDSYGDEGYAGVVAAYNRRAPLPQPDPTQPEPSIVRVGYAREDLASVDAAIARAVEFLEGVRARSPRRQSVGVVMIDSYRFGNEFIRALKDWLNADASRASRLDVLFSHVSSVGADALAALLSNAPADYLDVTDPTRRRAYADGVLVTEVVPSYDSEAPGVAAYRADIERFDGGPLSFMSLEGHLAARLFTDALALCPELTTDALRNALDTELGDVDLGIGARVGFSAIDHQASHTLWGSLLRDDGSMAVPFVWTPETGIRPN